MKLRRLFAAFICALILMLCFSPALLAGHVCGGEHCFICAALRDDMRLSALLFIAAALLCAHLCALTLFRLARVRQGSGLFPTLVSLKVKLSD